jgi:TetR/AcrR family transcriptional regulator, transcriptional repressor for nem operon
MAHSQAAKAQTHERILRVAAERLRQTGIDRLSIADLMKEAGLTVGGFYKHFRSRDDLVVEALGSVLGGWERELDESPTEPDEHYFPGLVERYLSEDHRDNPGAGCPIGALVGDVGRSNEPTRELYTKQIRRNIRLLARLLGASSSPPRRQQAILAYSAMLGAIALSRAVSDQPLSTEILASVKELLVKDASRGPQKKTAKTADAVLTRHPRRATKRNQEKT